MYTELQKLAEKYRKMGAKPVILYGSYARGDNTEEGDVDVLVVGDFLPEDPREAYLLLLDLDYPRIQPIGLNTQIFLRKLREGNTFILEVIEDGKILYAEEFLEFVKKEFSTVRPLFKKLGKPGSGSERKTLLH